MQRQQLVIHQPGTFTSDTLFDILCVIYVDDVEFLFESRNNIERVTTLLSDHFTWFDIEIYIFKGKNPSKTEFVFFPHPYFFNTRTSPLTDTTNFTMSPQTN